jgi:pre-mRNA-splicing factor CWC22
MTLKPGYEMELTNMVVECCTQERSYLKFYGLLAARFCDLQREYQDAFCQGFIEQYHTVHRLETNKLRQMAKLFAHLFFTDAIPWNVLEQIRLTETDTTSSSRIFIKELMLQMSEYMGVPAMVKRFSDP